MAQTVSSEDIILAPAWLWIGTYGTAVVPTSDNFTVAPTANWVCLGSTSDAVVLKIEEETKQIEVQQSLTAVASRTTARKISVSTTLAQSTYENIAYALNGGSVASGSGYRSFTPPTTVAGAAPSYKSLLLRGKGPSGLDRVFWIHKAYSTSGIELGNSRTDEQGLKVEFMGHALDDGSSPYGSLEAHS